ncbi:MAG: Gx transporter family protein, partial [Chitinivibrionales bacterium]
MEYQDSCNSEKVFLFIAAVTLNAAEIFLPRIPVFPWLKPGLTNIVTVVWILRFGYIDTLLFSLIRIIMIASIFGFSFITFLLSALGAFAAVTGMALIVLIYRSPLKKPFAPGTIGICITGAFLHNIGQLTAVYFLLAEKEAVFIQIPAVGAASLVFGTLTGLLVPLLYPPLKRLNSEGEDCKAQSFNKRVNVHEAFFSSTLLLICTSLAFITNTAVLTFAAAGITLLVQIVHRFSFKHLVFPLRRFYFLFIIAVFFNLFFSYGRSVFPGAVITYEGITASLNHCMRLWFWLQSVTLFYRLNFHVFIFTMLRRFFKSRTDTINAGLTA